MTNASSQAAAAPVNAPDPPVAPDKVRGSARGRKWLWRLGIPAALVVTMYLLRAPLLQGAAWLWIVNEPPVKADAIVVLGGGVQYRPFEAARLHREGFAPVVLTMNNELEPTDRIGLTTPESELVRQVLAKSGVPTNAIVPVGHEVSSTYEEALAIREWVQRTGARRVLIPTEIFHTRRVRWLMTHVLRPVGADAVLVAVSPKDYSAATWWQHEGGLISFQNEVIKWAYYHAKY